jgi:hypothetical protein
LGILFFRRPPGKILEHVSQITWQLRDELHPPAITRMRKYETRSVEKRPLQPLDGADVSRHAAMNAAVSRVAHDRVADST